MRVRRSILAMPLALAACLTHADKPPPDQAALVVLRFQEAPGGISVSRLSNGLPSPFGGAGVQTTLVLSQFDPATNQAARLPWQEVSLSVSSFTGPVNQTIAATIRPGTYAITRFTQAGKWAECFNSGTFAFDIAAGQAIYLGKLDAKLYTKALVAAVTAAHKETLTGLNNFVDYKPPPLHFGTVTPKDLQSAQDAATAADPAIIAPIQTITLRPATFSLTNRGLLGYGRICGSMFDVASDIL